MAVKAIVSSFAEVWRGVFSAAWNATMWKSDKIDLGVSVRDLVAMVIHQAIWTVDWQAAASVNMGTLIMGLFGRDLSQTPLVSADPITSPSCYVWGQRAAMLQESGWYQGDPIVMDYTGLPGGGLIVPCRPLYAGAKFLADAGTIYWGVDLHYSLVELDQANMLDLIQVLQGVGMNP